MNLQPPWILSEMPSSRSLVSPKCFPLILRLLSIFMWAYLYLSILQVSLGYPQVSSGHPQVSPGCSGIHQPAQGIRCSPTSTEGCSMPASFSHLGQDCWEGSGGWGKAGQAQKGWRESEASIKWPSAHVEPQMLAWGRLQALTGRLVCSGVLRCPSKGDIPAAPGAERDGEGGWSPEKK